MADRMDDLFPGQEGRRKELTALAAMLPPPVSLDTLTAVGGLSPVKTLQCLESLVEAGVLRPYQEAGPGHYFFPDQELAQRALEFGPGRRWRSWPAA